MTNSVDFRALVSLVDDARATREGKPREVSGGAGFADEENLNPLKQRRITAYLSRGRARHDQADAAGPRKLMQAQP